MGDPPPPPYMQPCPSLRRLQGAVTNVTMHCDPNPSTYCGFGSNCGVCLDLGALAGSLTLPLAVSANVPGPVATQLRAGNFYFLIGTTAFPGGELRGQGNQQYINAPTHRAVLASPTSPYMAHAFLTANTIPVSCGGRGRDRRGSRAFNWGAGGGGSIEPPKTGGGGRESGKRAQLRGPLSNYYEL